MRFILLLLIPICSLFVISCCAPFHEERYQLVEVKPDLYSKPIGVRNTEIIINRIKDVSITAKLTPTNLKNKRIWHWESAKGPYDFVIQFNNRGTIVKEISIKNLKIKYSPSNEIIIEKNNIDEKFIFPSPEEEKRNKLGYYKFFRLDDSLNLNFESGEKIIATFDLTISMKDNNETHEIEILFEPNLLKGLFQIPITH